MTATAGALFATYAKWAGENLHPSDRLTQKAFGARLRTRFSCREGRHTVFFGVALRQDERADDAA